MATPNDLLNNLPLISWKQRNAALDSFFYDTGSLTRAEGARLSPLLDKEGSIIVVTPAASGQPIRHYRKALRFMNNEGDTIRAIAVAGIGSSVLGTAALARNVADAIGFNVAGIITGYGISDILTETIGGWFICGTADRARLQVEELIERATTLLPEAASSSAIRLSSNSKQAVSSEPAGATMLQSHGMPGNYDVTTLVDILMARPPRLELLVDHSKGGLLIDFVLEQFVDELDGDDHPLFKRLQIVTLGAVAGIPKQFRLVRQYLRVLDWFGGMNSRTSIPHERVPNVWHHLNRELPYHMDTVSILQGR